MHLKSNDAQKFAQLIQQGIDSWVEAGKFAAKKIEENPNFIDEVCDQFPHITPEMVQRFQQIGTREIHPLLLLCNGAGPSRLRLLSYELQDKYSKEPVELLVKDGDKWEVLRVDVRNLTPDQAKQAIGRNGINSPAAQRAIIEDLAAKRVTPPTRSNLPYRMVKDDLVVMQPCRISKKDLARILADMA